MKTYPLWALVVVGVGLVAGCYYGPKSGRGFVLPTGSVERGQKAFVDLKCYECHRVDGVEGLPAPSVSAEKVVVLGGKVVRLRTYGDLVTAVIHPSFTLSENYTDPARKGMTVSPMKPVNDTMTVSQMIDLVTFLHPRYQELEILYHAY